MPYDAEGETLETVLGYQPELQRNRSMFTLLFQSLAIAGRFEFTIIAGLRGTCSLLRASVCSHPIRRRSAHSKRDIWRRSVVDIPWLDM